MDDRTAVIDTVNRYATALDSRDWALLDEVFTPDAVADFGAGPLASHVRAFSAGTAPAAGQSYELFGEYRDELVRTPDGWRIARRKMTIHHEIGSRDVLGSMPRRVDSRSA